jgi:hypothetical protein
VDKNTKLWRPKDKNISPTMAINPLVEFLEIPQFLIKTLTSEISNFNEDQKEIIQDALNGINSKRIYLLQNVRNSGYKQKRIDPFLIHSTRKYNSRYNTENSNSVNSATQFSFVEILYQNDNADDVVWLGRAAFLICIESTDEITETTNNLMLGGFIFLKPTDTGKKKNNLPYQQMEYMKTLDKKPEIDIIPLDIISAPTYVVADPQDYNDNMIHESLFTKSNREWKTQIYNWIPFSWTCRDDDILMVEEDRPQQSFDAREIERANKDLLDENDNMSVDMDDEMDDDESD